ncbi:MAG TPA: hypothetical protein VK918_09570 [Pyrinomonadaceae bacterium]|nr:hypothetical protein [Pyrinomonadaceae bacterium]
MKRFWYIFAVGLIAVLLTAGVGGYFYWSGLKETPQYSLALLIDAARRGDQPAIDRLVNTDAVVDSFVPQVTDKAVELYGRNQPSSVIDKAARVAEPLLPAVKDRARAELPAIIRRETERFRDVPFAAMAVGAGRYFDTSVEGENAEVRSLVPGNEFEVRMKRNGTGWQIVGVRDEALARQIAETIGQQLMAIAAGGDVRSAGRQLGGADLQKLMKQAEEAFE